MKKFTKVLENTSSQKKFEIIAEITLMVTAENEGEAGYLADSILGGIDNQVDFMIQDVSELTEDEYKKQYESVKNINWVESNGFLKKNFEFRSFKDALNFINKVGILSESMNHHPEITNNYNKVQIRLKTHDKKRITEIDYEMSKKIDDIYETKEL